MESLVLLSNIIFDEARENNDHSLESCCFRFFDQFQTVHSAHFVIRNQDIEFLQIGHNCLKGFVSIGKEDGIVAESLQLTRQSFSAGFNIIRADDFERSIAKIERQSFFRPQNF